eukprot:scaffold4004_cov254-Prasinococcus_capsulatus_cf.AAC.2
MDTLERQRIVLIIVFSSPAPLLATLPPLRGSPAARLHLRPQRGPKWALSGPQAAPRGGIWASGAGGRGAPGPCVAGRARRPARPPGKDSPGLASGAPPGDFGPLGASSKPQTGF